MRVPTFVILCVVPGMLAGSSSCTTQADLGRRSDSRSETSEPAPDAASDVAIGGSDSKPLDADRWEMRPSDLAPGESSTTDGAGALDGAQISPATCWAKGFGSTDWDVGTGVDVGADGHVYLTGFSNGGIDFGGGALAGTGTRQAVLASFASSGAHRWSKGFGEAARGLDVAVAESGDVYIIGTFQGAIDFGGGPLTTTGPDGSSFLASFTSNGTYRWSKSFAKSSYSYLHETGRRVGVDVNGNVYLTGQFQGPADFGGGTLSTSGPYDRDVFLVSFAANGAHRWSQRYGGVGNDLPGGLGVDGKGNVYLAGHFSDTADFGGAPLSAVNQDIFVASFTSTGAHRWSKGWGGGNSETASDLDVDQDGNVYVTGEFGPTADFGGGVLSASGTINLYLASYDSDGNHRWSKGFDVSGWSDDALGVEVDREGMVYITGSCGCLNLDFGGGKLGSSNGLRDIYVASFSPTGQHRWSTTFGGGINDQGYSLAVSPTSGRVYTTGSFEYIVDFGQGPVVSNGQYDLFLLCLTQ